LADILVVGDSMLDRYWEGVVERISPEAPVPVLRVTREFCRPGGAANVAANIKALGSDVSLLTVMGDDEPGRKLRALLDFDVHAVGSRTTQKIRAVSRHQQMLRTDFDECASVVDAGAVLAGFKPAPVVVFSDYAKGSLGRVREMLDMSRGSLTLVDPKGDLTKYAGAFLLKPNEAEVGGFDERKCVALRSSLGVQCLLVTLGERGMVLISEWGVQYVPTEAVDVYDVSGAGDTVIATLAHCLSKGATVIDAVLQANKAAGIVVGKFGTATVSQDELRSCAV
jgi:rfaE bifunctional protein kinase chain/domain